ncbi:MAG TPA: zf-HC2 domain-containing protein [Pyrinomonadaceae bacterium]
MDCGHVAELLPWLKNGSLAGPEQELVREHLAQCHACQQELSETSLAWSVYQQHLPTEALVNLAYDRSLVASQQTLYDRHLKACTDCAEQLDLVRASRRLEAAEESAEPGVIIPLASRRAVRWQGASVWRYGAIAAALLFFIAAGGWLRSWQQLRNPQTLQSAHENALRERLAGLETENERLHQQETQLNQQQNQSNAEIAQLRSQIQEAQKRIEQQQDQIKGELAAVSGQRPGKDQGAPQINILTLDIFPVGMIQRDTNRVRNSIVIPGNAKALTLMLHSQAVSDSPSYYIEIVDAHGRVVWKSRGLVRQPTNDYTISIPADYLSPGSYTISIYGTAAGKRVKVEGYEVGVKRS